MHVLLGMYFWFEKTGGVHNDDDMAARKEHNNQHLLAQ